MDTQSIIDAALKGLKHEKEEKRLGKQRQGKRKGMTLEELEEAENSTVKESKVGMASTKRAKTRKGAVADTDLVDKVEEVEEQLEKDEDDGIKLEPFNLEQERQEGYFDEGGNYVENTADSADKDSWLASEAGVVSEAVQRQIAERKRQQELKDTQPELSGAQAAAYKRDMAGILLPGETVSRAMNRLRPPPQHKLGSKAKANKAQPEHAAEIQDAAADKLVHYQKLKTAADELMDTGELDVYSLTREDLERGAALFAPVGLATGPGGNDEDDDDDMFANPESVAVAPAAPASTGNAAPDAATAPNDAVATASQPPASAHPALVSSAVATAKQEPEVDYSSWPIKELRRFLQDRGENPSGIVEKSDLVVKVRELAAKGPEGADEAASASALPAGYLFDAGTGYYYSAESGMYYDSASGGFFSSEQQKWYSYQHETGQFVEWQLPAS